MKNVRFQLVLLLALAGGVGAAAPVPKGAGQADPTPDLKAFFTAVGKAVENEKWPAEADEKLLRDTARVIFERATKAAEQKDRKLPVDFDKLKKLDVVKEVTGGLDGAFLIVKDVRVTGAQNSVIFSSGHVQITSATNCVIVAQSVRCTVLNDCVVVAGDYLRATGADRGNGQEGSVLVAGRLIRITGATGAICHVVHPALGQQLPEEKFPDPMSRPIRMTSADGVTFLNAAEYWKTTSNKNCTTIELKTPIAK